MMRQTLRAVLCLATLAAICALATAQTTPASETPPPTAPSEPGTAPIPSGQPEPTSPAPDYLPSSLTYQIGILLEDPAVARDHWGIMVTNLDGALIYGLNQAQLFQPASNAKLFTTAAAMALLGANRRFSTQVVASGNLSKKGLLHGDLKLVGGGDPSFGTLDLPYLEPSARPKNPPAPPTTIANIEELADKVYASGLRTVEGNIVGDDSQSLWEPYPADWDRDDLIYGYGAPVSALSIHDNQIDVQVSPGGQLAFIRTNPDTPYYAVQDYVTTTGPRTTPDCNGIGYRRAAGTKDLVAEGSISSKQTPCTQAIAIEDPAEYAAIAFKAALQRRGIRVTGAALPYHEFPRTPELPDPNDSSTRFIVNHYVLQRPYSPDTKPNTCQEQAQIPAGGPEPPEQTVLATHESPPLSEDLTYTLKTSQNLHAEMLLRDSGVAVWPCHTSQSSGLIYLHEYLAHIGIDKDDFVFYDGSGLSNHDLVTPRATAKLLQFATTQPWFATWKASLPVGGEDGTLENRFANPPLKDHLFAKTGTLGEARALSGYLDAASGRTVIFSIMVDNHLPGTTADRDVMDKIVAAIQTSE